MVKYPSHEPTGGSSNGRTAHSGCACRGSNPLPPAYTPQGVFSFREVRTPQGGDVLCPQPTPREGCFQFERFEPPQGGRCPLPPAYTPQGVFSIREVRTPTRGAMSFAPSLHPARGVFHFERFEPPQGGRCPLPPAYTPRGVFSIREVRTPTRGAVSFAPSLHPARGVFLNQGT